MPRRLPVLALLAFCLLLWRPPPAAAQADEPVSAWSYSFYKTLTYEAVVNAGDALYYATVMGGGGAAAVGLFTAANVATAGVVYYLHELAWNLYGPSQEEYAQAPIRIGFLKTAGYRVASTARNLALGYAFTGSPWASAGFALWSNLWDPLVYVANEYAWNVYGPPMER
jgi:uncharacterized membrane protein